MTDLKKTSLELPLDLWKRAKVRAAQEEADLREVIIRSLEAYLKTPLPKGGKNAR